MIGVTLKVAQLGDSNEVVSTKDLHFTSHDGVDSLNTLIKDEFELDTAARLKFCYEEMPFDPSDPPVYKPLTAAAIVGCLLEYLVEEDPLKLWLPLENGRAELAFTVVAAPAAAAQHTPHHTTPGPAVSGSAAARSATAGATTPATQQSTRTASASVGRKGKQKSQPWQDYLKQLARENIPRGSCGQYYLAEDNLKDAGQIHG
jgi:hypothetical protein